MAVSIKNQVKDQVWEATFDRVARTVDGMGKRIDRGIIFLILALNASDIATTFSCEGHLDHGHPYPWVWVPTTHQDALTAALMAFYQQHKASDDRTLVIACNVVEDECVLRPRGYNLQEMREYGRRLRKLKQYQKEMQAFALFLKERFFSE